MMMPHEVQEMLDLLREVNGSLKALVAASEKPGQGGPKTEVDKPSPVQSGSRSEPDKSEEPKRR